MEVLAQYAPNINDIVLGRQVLTPLDLERTYGLTGGNIMQGAMGLDQLGPLRLDYRTPVPGLYLCGAAAHPGGGVMGVAGRNAASAVLRD
jgi:phytoene dehydrogenase-like protein